MAIRIAGLLVVLAASVATVVCQTECSSINIRTCGDCISVAGCAWCFQEDFLEQRCQPSNNFSTSCNEPNQANPSSSVTRLNAREDLSSPVSLLSADLSLRVGDPQTFQVQVTPQRNLPLDLYILIDLSGSMDAELATIKLVSSSIAENISDITNNVRLGLGAFNDKIVRPFSQEPIDGVCDASNPSCTSYAFRHVINLTDDNILFAATVNSLNLTENVDPPENGLEGLAQVIACEQEVGWRVRVDNRGTRVVLFMTDGDFHYAGEGRLAGILRPYTGQCLLRHNPASGYLEYTLYKDYDYPSIGQVLFQMETFDVSVIFAVRDTHQNTYENLMNLLNTNSRRSSVDSFSPDGTTFTNTDSNASAIAAANERVILELINREHIRLLQDVSLAVGDRTSDDVTIKFVPLCPENSTITDVGGCAGVAFDIPVTFNVTVTLSRCNPADHGTVRTEKVNSPSFGSFLINYMVICDCDCSEDMFYDPLQCNGTGNVSCGVCVCFNGTCGVKCDRLLGERTNVECPIGGINQEICSGTANGVCDCGCRCNSIAGGLITGDLCQCNDFGCPDSKINGKSCSDRGLCCSGNCICYYSNMTTGERLSADPLIQLNSDDRYRGEGSMEYCQCDSLNRACRQSPGAELCNGRGECGCNFCICNTTYKGRYCELSGNDSCGYPMDVECILQCRDAVNKEANIPDKCDLCNPTRPVLFINEVELEGLNSINVRQHYEDIANTRLGQSGADGSLVFKRDQCTIIDKDNCMVDYVILANATQSAIISIRQRVCMTTNRLVLSTWALALIILGIVLLLLGIGIVILILIKIILTILDYLELKRWERKTKEADFSKQNQNPLYQSPEMKYENVAYGRE